LIPFIGNLFSVGRGNGSHASVGLLLICSPEAFLLYVYDERRCETMLAVRLPEEIEARLAKLAKATGRSKSYYVREALGEYLDDLEDIYLAEKELEEVRAGRSTPVPLEEVRKRYGMDD
jgi:RHH-type rel operon transcriptional repressor/antitoxin RelB